MKTESEYKELTDELYIIQRKLGANLPTDDDLNKLEFFFESISEFYIKLNNMSPPMAASSVHGKFKEQYSLASDAMLHYFIAVSQNDITYFEKSVENSKEANRIGSEASDEFVELLSGYSITCSEIGLCE